MPFRKRRDALRSILSGSSCIHPGSVYDATSIRIAQDLGFELGMFGGSVASLAVLGDPDVTLITLTELAEQMRRRSRAADLPVLVDDVMTKNPKTISRDMLASEALEILNSSKITALIVTDAGKPVGIVHLHDILRSEEHTSELQSP